RARRHILSGFAVALYVSRRIHTCLDYWYPRLVLTVLIPTHNRPGYLRRCLDYLVHTAPGARVVVADSSEGVAFEQNVELVRNPSSTIRIDHIDCRGKDITEKYVYALSSIDTLFVVVCGDDDFLVYENALRCADFLRTHQDYSHAHGRIITF